MRNLFFCLFLLPLLNSCITVVIPGSGPVTEPGRREDARKGKDYKPYESLGIPPGHLPPPGSCRIWYPGKPPGHQPPPGNCSSLSLQVPPGAWLIHRPSDNPKEVKVDMFDQSKRGVVIDVIFYLMN